MFPAKNSNLFMTLIVERVSQTVFAEWRDVTSVVHHIQNVEGSLPFLTLKLQINQCFYVAWIFILSTFYKLVRNDQAPWP